jgi:hypothetical protein
VTTGPRDTHGEDAAWREIVDNYGDRPHLEPEPEAQPTQPAPEPDQHPELADDPWLEERFVPPPPPPLPRVPFDRLLAWAGVFVSPLVLLVATVFQLDLPTLVAWALVLGFLGGFGYLVAQMPRGPRDPFDDGAVL